MIRREFPQEMPQRAAQSLASGKVILPYQTTISVEPEPSDEIAALRQQLARSRRALRVAIAVIAFLGCGLAWALLR